MIFSVAMDAWKCLSWFSWSEWTLTKHSAASSMWPNWKRCWLVKESARALRRASGGREAWSLYWNWVKMTYGKRRKHKISNRYQNYICKNKFLWEKEIATFHWWISTSSKVDFFNFITLELKGQHHISFYG